MKTGIGQVVEVASVGLGMPSDSMKEDERFSVDPALNHSVLPALSVYDSGLCAEQLNCDALPVVEGLRLHLAR
jgi:hypothetical protein